MNSDELIKNVLEHDIADTMQLLAEGYDPHIICAAKLRNVLMIYKTTLAADEYASMIQCIVDESDNVPDLNDYTSLMKVTGIH